MPSQFFTQHQPLHIGQLMPALLTPPAAVRYDFSALGKLAGDAGFVREIQQMFIDRVPGQVAQLQANIEVEAWPVIAQQAHSLKATFGNLRIEPGTALLKEIESIANQQCNKPELLALLQVVANSAQAVVAIFRQELSRAA